MMGAITFVYGVASYVVFLGAFLYAIGFVANVVVPKGIDSGGGGGVGATIVVDLLLLGVFAIQHTIMARRGFKRAWTRIVSPAIERSTFVLVTSLVLILLFWQWRALPGVVWEVHAPAASALLWALCALGWLTVLAGTFMIDHFHLFGLSQVWARLRGRTAPEPRFQTRWLYRFIRHPLMIGFIIAFWATPRMSWGHLLFATATTGYILIGALYFEERDLEHYIGEPYRRYRERVPAFLPLLGRSVASQGPAPAAGGDPAS